MIRSNIAVEAGMQPDEHVLIARAQAGDNDAFADIYSLFANKIEGYLCRTVDPDTAKDLTQETFLKAFRSIGNFEHRGGSIAPWLHVLANNTRKDHFRAADNRPVLSPMDCSQDWASSEDIETWVMGGLALQQVVDKLARAGSKKTADKTAEETSDNISEEIRETALAILVEDQDRKTYAEETGVIEDTIRTRVFRARRYLKKLRDKGELSLLDTTSPSSPKAA